MIEEIKSKPVNLGSERNLEDIPGEKGRKGLAATNRQ